MVSATIQDFELFGGIVIEESYLPRLLQRASAEVDLLIGGPDEKQLTDRQVRLIKNAICCQVEYLYENGDTASNVGTPASFSIGSYSESSGQGNYPKNSRYSRYASGAIDYLRLTGLLYGAVDLI